MSRTGGLTNVPAGAPPGMGGAPEKPLCPGGGGEGSLRLSVTAIQEVSMNKLHDEDD